MSFANNLLLFGAAMLAGAVNSVAGGGTLLTFPALLATGQLANIANATSTVALWPGQLSSLLGYRKEIGSSRTAILALGVPSLIGGGIGARLLTYTPSALFERIVPFLILLATVLFMAQGPISRRLRAQAEGRKREDEPQIAQISQIALDSTEDNRQSAMAPARSGGIQSEPQATAQNDRLEIEKLQQKQVAPRDADHRRSWGGVMVFQFFVAIYGGYFGAGIGILMLAALGFMGFTDIHRMNGLKNINGLLINAVAIVIFVTTRTLPGQGVGPHHDRMVDWPIALLMAAGSIIGGYAGAGTARRIGQQNVRRIVVFIGLALTLSLLLRHH